MFVDNAEENEERALFAIGVVEITVIFLLNAFTVPIYTSRNRHLRMPSTLILNLTVSEFLVGTVTGLSLIFAIILWSWLFSLILSSMFSLLILRASPVFPYVSASYFFLCLLILTVSYAIIISNGKNKPHHPNTGLTLSKEEKLTVTLFPVSVVSFLTILPIYLAIRTVNSSTAYGVSYAMQSFSASLTYFLCQIISALYSIP